MKVHLLNLLKYNMWANEKLLAFVNEAGEERAMMEQRSSFSTIRQTIIHILDAEDIWLQRLNGISIKSWPGKNFTGSAKDACMLLVEKDREWMKALNNIPPESLFNSIAYTNLRGENCSNTIIEVITHLVNHGTYHRGQLITMLRIAGFEKVSTTDLINYYRSMQV